jgi:EEF1A lysine methyltransferase 4
MDVTDMKDFQNDQFNIIIDKGTLDSILCGENSIPIGEKMMAEVYRILAPGGTFICISYGDENNRKSFFVKLSKV